tara:strand:+ start:222 stop:377 length:156 start_codon:yes stop_codon:yes gene_type:complete
MFELETTVKSIELVNAINELNMTLKYAFAFVSGYIVYSVFKDVCSWMTNNK